MNDLYTKYSNNMPAVPWSEKYPRPQMKRNDWMSLNGLWDYSDDGGNTFSKINVPFCPESILSGIHKTYNGHAELIYTRSFSIPDSWSEKNILINFGAVDCVCDVSVNGIHAVSHSGGYLHFSEDITSYLNTGENTITVKCSDDIDHNYPWGKQRVDRGGMWYTPVSGIWQSVWLEPVEKEHIDSLKVSTHENKVYIEVKGCNDGYVLFNNHRYPLEFGKCAFEVENAAFWSPENPVLYEYEVCCGKDTVSSYFALRDLTIETVDNIKRLCLNGKPYFFNGLLDQGYWSDGLYTPPCEKCYEDDILSMKSLGFNTLRKHIKIEPEQFYYDCDRLGMIVFQDMVNNSEYSFFRDTALPTVRIQKLGDRFLHTSDISRKIFTESMISTVESLYNHPSICYWTIFNEGWGQFCADKQYMILKGIDSTRFIDSTSGWFRRKKSDVESLHIYFTALKLTKSKKAQVISEFGGFSYKIPDHSFNLEKTYGYRKYTDKASFINAFRKLYTDEVIPLIKKGLCAAIYTQVSDVEDETNGILTFDRCEMKVRKEDIADVFDQLTI